MKAESLNLKPLVFVGLHCVNYRRLNLRAGFCYPPRVVDPKRIETLREQIRAYEANLASFQRMSAELRRLPATAQRERMFEANQETISAIQHSITIARSSLASLLKAPRIPGRDPKR